MSQLNSASLPTSEPEPNDLAQKREILRRAIEDHEPKLRDTAQAIVYSLNLARHPAQVAEFAKEAVQLAAQRVLEEAAAYQTERPPYPWVRKFVFNAVLTLRSQHRTERKHLTLVSDMPPVQGIQEEDEVTEEELLDWLRTDRKNPEPDIEWEEVFRFMHPEDRLVLTLYLEDYTGEALAAELTMHLGRSISRGAADTRLSRAKGRLPEAYREYTRLSE